MLPPVGSAELALRQAAASPNTTPTQLESLCRKVTNINAPSSNGNTALHWAIQACHVSNDPKGMKRVQNVVVLLKNGADCNAKNNLGETPLHFAASKHATDVIRQLMEKNVTRGVRDNNGLTAAERITNIHNNSCLLYLTMYDKGYTYQEVLSIEYNALFTDGPGDPNFKYVPER